MAALLFKLNNMPPNFEVGVHLYQINTTSNRAAGGLDQRVNVAICSIKKSIWSLLIQGLKASLA